MSQARSQVQVTITGNLDKGFDKAFQAADSRMEELGKAAQDLNRKVADVGAYRRQQNALKDAASEYTKAKAKVAALKAELQGVENPTRKQAAALHAAERAAARANTAYTQARTKLADMGRELQRSGVNVGKLSNEYRRLQAELKATVASQNKAEASLKRQQAIVKTIATAWQGIGKAASTMASVTTGAVAGGAVLAQPTKKALTYEEQLAYMADTAGAGQSPAQKMALQKQLSDSIEAARQYSKGATREEVASALQTMIASGQFENGAAARELPKVARTAFAAGATPQDVANIAIAAQNFGVKDLASVFDKSLRAGQLGRNELRDMAGFLPQQMAMAKAAGFSGEQGLTDLLAFNQVAMLTAGNAAEANNNVVNLLKKFSSREFSDSIAKEIKVQAGDPYTPGKKGAKQFDWAGYMLQQREKGIDPITAFGALLDRQLAGDKRYQELQKRAKAAGSDQERKAVIGQMSSIVEGSAVGQIIADSEALKAALASLYGRQRMAELKTGINSATGFVNQSAEFLGSQNFAGAKLLTGNLDRANEQAYEQLQGPLKSLIDTLNQGTQEFPKLTTAAYGAATALGAVAAAGLGMGAYNLLTKGGAAAAGAAGLGAGAAAAGAGGGIMARLAPAAKWLRTGAVYGGLAAAEYAGLPNTDAKVGQEAWRKGEYLKASAYMPAGDFLKAVWGKISGTEETAKQAAAAAQETAKAATTAAGRPNITVHNSVTVTAPPGADPGQMQAAVNKALQEAERRMRAEQRSSMTDRMGH